MHNKDRFTGKIWKIYISHRSFGLLLWRDSPALSTSIKLDRELDLSMYVVDTQKSKRFSVLGTRQHLVTEFETAQVLLCG